MTSGFNIKHYNNLPSLVEACRRLESELRGSDFEKYFLLSDDIRRLFSGEAEAPQFGIFIAHRHARLEEGERMVSRLISHDILPRDPLSGFHSKMQPISTKGSDNSTRIVPSSWMFVDGNFLECEYKEVENDHSEQYLPPSPNFFQTFKEICDRFGITVLGIFSLALTHSKVNGDSVLLREEFKLEPRSRTARLFRRSEIEKDMVSSSWIPGLAKELWLVGTVEDVTILEFNYESYNNLLSPFYAHKELREQVQRQGISKFHDLFTQCIDLRKLFLEGPEAGHYGITLAHRHHRLQSGERMVMTDEPPPDKPEYMTVSTPRSSSQEVPNPESDERIVATSWILVNDKFEEYEHKAVRSDANDNRSRYLPPSPRFLREFRRLCRSYQINMLGIFSRELPYGQLNIVNFQESESLLHFFLETSVAETREQMTQRLLRKDLDEETAIKSIRSGWILFRTSNESAIRKVVEEICTKEEQGINRAKEIVDEREAAGSREIIQRGGDNTADTVKDLDHDLMKLADLLFFQGSDIFMIPGSQMPDSDTNDFTTDGLSCQHICQPDHF